MSNQNLNTLNVETLNFTGPTIYHRGRPWFPMFSSSLCTDYLGVGPFVQCPGDPVIPIYDKLSLQVINNAQISTTLSITPSQNPSNKSGLRLSAPYDGIGSYNHESEIQFTNNFTSLDGFGLLFDGSNNFYIKKYVTGASGNIFTLKKDTGFIGLNFTEPVTLLDICGNTTMRGYLDMSCNPIKDVSGIFFCKDSSGIDMSCNPITDVSGIYFCDGSSFTHGNSLDISANTVHITNTNLIVDGSGLIQTLTVGLGGGAVGSNTVVGYQALQKNTTGKQNVALGYQALNLNTGENNVALGYQALEKNGNGGENTASGSRALQKNTTGYYNTATGYQALQANTIGNFNVAIGGNALKNNTDGSYNVAVGYSALLIPPSSIHNTAIGYQALYDSSGNFNTATGSNALYYNQDGSCNVAVGYQALYHNTDGSGNVALGYQALYHNTDGSGNVALGYNALQHNSYGKYNTATGALALEKNGTASYCVANGYAALENNVSDRNTATGYKALQSNTSGYYNTATGYNALQKNITGPNNTAMGHLALGNNTDGSANTAIGATALSYNTDGCCNVAIGANTLVNNEWGSNNVAVGYQALVNNKDGSCNVATGSSALSSNKTGGSNVAVGYLALQTSDASYNTAVGSQALSTNTGNQNTATGYKALANNTGGSNVATGYAALFSNTGGGNVAVGYAALTNNSGNYNTATGYFALQTNDASYNTAIGSSALTANTSGAANVAIGSNALYSNKTGGSNVAVGYYALFDNSGGFGNTATGHQALYKNSVSNLPPGIGNHNTATGYQALYDNSGGHNNTATGVSALKNNKAGIENVATGNYALSDTSGGSHNVATGYLALNANRADCNTATGHQALQSNTTGGSNTAIGASALLSNQTGEQNTAVGLGTLVTNQTGDSNVAIGYAALYYNDASYNTAIGASALYTNTSGAANVATGRRALYSNKTGGSNVATGNAALYYNDASYNTAIGYAAMNSNKTGGSNVAIGYYALYSNKTGGKNVAVGSSALNTNDVSYNTAIGYAAMNSNKTGGSNVAIGYEALYTNDASENTAIGYEALYSNTTGNNNVATGSAALYSNRTGSNNVAVGYYALQTNDASNNTAIGSSALTANQTGEQNVAVGYSALKTNTIGGSNVATGYAALYKNTDGSSNVAIGNAALYNNTANENVAIGASALYLNTSGVDNVATGFASLYLNKTGSNNVATGHQALYSNTDGSGNVATGSDALYSNETGNGNVAIGYTALNSNVDGSGNVATGHAALYNNKASWNTATGYNALQANTTGFNNVATGYQALHANQTGISNTAVGYQALLTNVSSGNVAVGMDSLTANTSGSKNVAIGTNALQNNITGNNNTAIGYNAGNIPTDISNTINIGYDTHTVGSNTACIGDADISCVYLGSISGLAKLDCSGITTTGDIDMSCNRIIDVSGIYFCDGSSFTHGDSLDISGDGISFLTNGNGTEQMTIDQSGNVAIGPAGWIENTTTGNYNWSAITSSSDGTKLAAVVVGGNIWTSSNSGATWTEDTSVGTTKAWYGITSSSDGAKLAAVVNGGNPWTSNNSGATWTERTSVGTTKAWYGITSSSNGTKLAAVVNGGYPWTSTDSGVSWQEHTGFTNTKSWWAIASSSDGTKLVAVVYDENIYTSTYPFNTWTKNTTAPATGWHDIASSAYGTKLAAVQSGGGNIWTSTNSGVNWTESGPVITNWSGITSSSDGTKLAAVVDGGYIWTSTNSGLTWIQATSLPPATEAWSGITSSSDGMKLAAVVDGGNIWTFQTISVNIGGSLQVSGITTTGDIDCSGIVTTKVRIGPLDATSLSPNYISDASDSNLEILSNYTVNNFAVNNKKNPNALRIIAEVNIPATASGIQQYGHGVEMINFTPYMPSNTDERYKHNVSASIIAGVSPLPNNWGNTKGYLAFATSSQLNEATYATQLIEKMRIRSDGRVGIGTQYPAAMLDISANQWNKVSTGASDIALPYALQTKGQVKMFPPPPGDMIGNYLLDVSGNVKIRGYLDMSCNRIIDVSGISFCKDSSGIDMSCNPITDVSGIYFCDGSSFTHGNSLDISGAGIAFMTKGDGTEQMKILSNGYVGIGTTTPSALLDVNGDISGSGILTLSSLKIDGAHILSTSSTAGIIIDPSNGTTNLIGKVTVLAPTADFNPATKQYVDQNASGLKVQQYVDLATTSANTNIFLNGIQTIDGTTVVAGKRVLVKNQDGNELNNGVYIAAVGTWVRAPDFNTAQNISGYYVFVEGGTENLHTGWVVTGTNIVVGTNDITFSKFSSTGNIEPGRGLEKQGEILSVKACDSNGVYTLTAPTLGTPASGTLTLCTGLPAANITQGTMAPGMVLVSPALGTPTSGDLTNCSGTAAGLTSGKVSIADNASNADWPVVFNDENHALLDDNGTLLYNPSSGTLKTTEFVGGGSGITGVAAHSIPAANITQGTMAPGMVLVSPALGTPTSGDLTNCSGTAAGLTSGKVSIADNAANIDWPVVFNDENHALLDDNGTLLYNPSSGTLKTTEFVGGGSGITGVAAHSIPAANITQGTMAPGMVLVSPALGTPTSGDLTNCSGTAAGLTSGKVSIADSAANIDWPVVFNDENHALLDDNGTLLYNPSSGTLKTTEFVGGGSGITGVAAHSIPAANITQGTMAPGMVLVSPALGTPTSGDLTNCSGTAAGLTSGKVSIADSAANIDWPVVFNDENHALLDDNGTLLYNPSSGTLKTTEFVGGGSGITGITQSMVGLGNVDNTSDVNKPVSTAQGASIALKVGLTGNETIAGNKTFSGTLTSDTVDINGGAIDGTTIGATTKASGGFTAVNIDPNNVAGGALMISNSTVQTAGTDLVRITGQSPPFVGASIINALNVAAGDVHIEDRLNVNDDVTIYGNLAVIDSDLTVDHSIIIRSLASTYNSEMSLKVYGGGETSGYYTSRGPEGGYISNQYFNWTNEYESGLRNFDTGTGISLGVWAELSICCGGYIIADQGFTPSDVRTKKNITDIDENDALQIIRKIKSKKYNLRDEKKDRNSRYGFIAHELKECLPEAVSMMREFIPSELRVCNNVSWTTITDSSGNTNHKLTIHDLNDSSGNQAYRFYVSNDISGNDEILKDIVSLEDDPQSFIFDAKYKNIFIYGKQVHDFLIVDKSVLITMVIPVIQNMDKVQQEEKTKLAFAKAKLSVLESENKELKTRLASVEARLDAAGI